MEVVVDMNESVIEEVEFDVEPEVLELVEIIEKEQS